MLETAEQSVCDAVQQALTHSTPRVVTDLIRTAPKMLRERRRTHYQDKEIVGTADDAVAFLEEVGHPACGLNPDIGNFVRLHRPLEPIQEMFDKLLPHTNYWHVKNYLRDEDPGTGQVMTFPVPMYFGLINYRAAITQALGSASAAPSSVSTTAAMRSL